ncbi:MAG: prolipoprotein diacylglyceryl transferase, partial [Candidatus Eremiobacteraeota bacterium]|nr:prolipoprotein diacylglyceryl transferase [Candidatus Eremiobacteraeota bacterium]
MNWVAAAPIYAISYFVAVAMFGWMARRRGLANEGTWILMQAALVGGLLGANLVQVAFAGQPGKTIEGGFIGGYLAVVWMKRRMRIARPTGDLFALAFPAGEAIGRIGCFVGGCCYGKIAHVAWAVHQHDAWRHPAQLYASAIAAISFVILLWLERRDVLLVNGLFFVQGMLF